MIGTIIVASIIGFYLMMGFYLWLSTDLGFFVSTFFWGALVVWQFLLEISVVQRIVCAVIGHRWHGAGWIGEIINWGQFIHQYRCWRCGAETLIAEPKWHRSARYRDDVPFGIVFSKPPHKFTGAGWEYGEQLEKLNKSMPIEALAEIHRATVEELRKAGYE